MVKLPKLLRNLWHREIEENTPVNTDASDEALRYIVSVYGPPPSTKAELMELGKSEEEPKSEEQAGNDDETKAEEQLVTMALMKPDSGFKLKGLTRQDA